VKPQVVYDVEKVRIRPDRSWTFAPVPNWLGVRPEVLPAAKLLYARLIQHAGAKGEAYPRINTLAKELGMCRNNVKKLLDHLVTLELITIESGKDSGESNRYIFLNNAWIEDFRALQRSSKTSRAKGAKNARGWPLQCLPVATLVPTGGHSSTHPSEDIQEEIHENIMCGGAATLAPHFPPAQEELPAKREELDREQQDLAITDEQESPAIADDQDNADDQDIGVVQGIDQDIGEAMDQEQLKAKLEAMKAQMAKTGEHTAQVLMDQATKKQASEVTATKSKRKPRWSRDEVEGIEDVWREEMHVRHPDLQIPRWTEKEYGQAGLLLVRANKVLVADSVRFVLRYWSRLVSRYFKKSTPRPNIGILLKYSDELLIDAQEWAKHRRTLEEYAIWEKDHPGYCDEPDKDLSDRYQLALDTLNQMGIR